MDVDESTYRTPFPPNSVNILCASTNAGKTTLALNVIRNQHLYFCRPLARIVVVLCNPIVDNRAFYLDGVNEETRELIVVVSLEDFDVESDLIAGTFLIFEDVQFLNKTILNCVNLHAHHSDLESVFIICQGLLGSHELFKLLSLAHRVVLFFSSSAATRLARYLVSSFFHDGEVKEYLKTIIAHAEKHKSVLLLDLNQLNGENKPRFLALDGVDQIAEMKPAVVYPHTNERRNYDERFDKFEVDEADTDHDLPPGAFILVPAANVRRRTMSTPDNNGPVDDLSDAKRILEEMNRTLE